MPASVRVALCRSDDYHHRYLSAVLRATLDMDLEIVEPMASQRRRILQTRGFWDRCAYRYHALRRKVLRLDQYRRRYFQDAPAARDIRRIEVENINCDTVIGELRTFSATDVVVCIGTSILSPHVLAQLAVPVINIHGGYLPHYRGNHCFFFASWNADWERIGSTIHFVDHGIDTGDIIAHVLPPYRPWEHPETLYCRAEKAAIHALVLILKGHGAGQPIPRAPQSRRYPLLLTRHRTPLHEPLLYLRLWWRWILFRLRRKNVESAPEGTQRSDKHSDPMSDC